MYMMQVFNASIPKKLFERLMYIVCSQVCKGRKGGREEGRNGGEHSHDIKMGSYCRIGNIVEVTFGSSTVSR